MFRHSKEQTSSDAGRQDRVVEQPARIAPDFFIIGAPKCGTTSLYQYLSRHPGIFLPSIKEPLFFCGEHLSVVRDYAGYMRLFAKAKQSQIVGEASALYLHFEAAVPRILALNAQAKFIVMVRNPIDMAISYHNQTLYSFEQAHRDFKTAWEASDDPASGMATNCRDPRLLNYKAICRLGEQLARVKSIVDELQLHVIVFDDLRANPRAVYEQTLSFLGLPCHAEMTFPVANGRMEHRYPLLGKALLAPPPPFEQVRAGLQRRAPVLAKTIGRYLLNLNRRPGRTRALDRAVHAAMAHYFEADIQLLGTLLGRDLHPWLFGRPLPNRCGAAATRAAYDDASVRHAEPDRVALDESMQKAF